MAARQRLFLETQPIEATSWSCSEAPDSFSCGNQELLPLLSLIDSQRLRYRCDRLLLLACVLCTGKVIEAELRWQVVLVSFL